MSGEKKGTHHRQELAAALREREEALRRFEEWERRNPHYPDPAIALAGIGWLYELLPEASRERPVDVSGIQRLHRCLAHLNPRSFQ
jgi:hypothetical protein